MFTPALLADAATLLAELRVEKLRLATAESCTGGLIAALLTEIPAASDVLERGFVVYSNAAKVEMLGVPQHLLDEFSAVSRETAIAMAEGALRHSRADVAVAVTGVAGPGSDEVGHPIGLVHLAAVYGSLAPLHQECRFDPATRAGVRLATAAAAVALVHQAIAPRY